MINTNLKGVWLTSKHVGQHFIERGEDDKIVSTSSTAGELGLPGQAHYVSAKHGVIDSQRRWHWNSLNTMSMSTVSDQLALIPQ